MSRLLFLFPHPDDDLFVSGILSHSILEDQVEAAWLTSGGFDGLEEVRELEIDRAMHLVGLKRNHQHLLRLPDGGLVGRLNEAVEKVRNLVSDFQPDSIWVTAFEGGHADHDATNFIARAAVQRVPRLPSPAIYEFPCYSPAGPQVNRGLLTNAFPDGTSEVRYHPLDEKAIRLKDSILDAYESQREVFKRLSYPDRERLRLVGEPFRKVPENRDYYYPPVPGLDSYAHWFNSRSRNHYSALVTAMRSLGDGTASGGMDCT